MNHVSNLFRLEFFYLFIYLFQWCFCAVSRKSHLYDGQDYSGRKPERATTFRTLLVGLHTYDLSRSEIGRDLPW